MIKTKVLFGKEAREKIMQGVNVMADAVSSTLGPRGRNVAVARAVPTGEIYERIVTHDGVTVARCIELEDEAENLGAQLLKQASQKQVDKVGDGTTVVMVLARAIIEESLELKNPMSVRRELEQALPKLIKAIEKRSTPIKTYEEMLQIATISAEDSELGKLVADTMKKVGEDGLIDVAETKDAETSVEHQEGMQIDKGYIHQYFVTDPDRMEARFEDPQLLVTDKPITSLLPLTNLFTSLMNDKVRRPLVIISPDISGEALALLIQNKMKGILYTLGIKAPSFGQNQKNVLQDIAILTGAKFITEDAGHKFEDVTINDLGQAKLVTSTKDETKITAGLGSKEKVVQRINSIKTLLDNETQEFDKEKLKERLGKLTSGISVIHVGGATEIEMKERRDRVVDAVAALKSAMNKGIVPGGEVIYLSILDKLNDKITGERILKEALKKPFKKLVENAGFDGGEKLAQWLPHYGFDVTDGQFKDMIKEGIVDPVEVSIEALKNSISVAIQIITSATVVVPIIKDKK